MSSYFLRTRLMTKADGLPDSLGEKLILSLLYFPFYV